MKLIPSIAPRTACPGGFHQSSLTDSVNGWWTNTSNSWVIQWLSHIHPFDYCCCCSVSKSRLTLCNPWTAAHQASLSFTISWSLLKFMSFELMMLLNYLILCRQILLLPSIFPSIRVFSNESALHIRWPRYPSFSFCPSNEYSGLISFRIDWFDLLTVRGTL